MARQKKLLIIDAAALGFGLLSRNGSISWNGLRFEPMDTVFPAVTCTAQASFRTASAPAQHGMVANGLFFRNLRRPLFWEQSSALVDGRRIWQAARAAGHNTALLFWQQSLGEDVDMLLSPAPIHKHHGGMIQNCYEKPSGLYAKTRAAVGRDFNLMHYWGPLAGPKSSEWIADATCAMLQTGNAAPDICLTYLPVLDYDLQRHGPDSQKATQALNTLLKELKHLMNAAAEGGYDVLIFGDYAMTTVTRPAAFPNRALRDAGLLRCSEIRGMLYPDFHESEAFAVTDHEAAHVYVRSEDALERTRKTLEELNNVDEMLTAEEQHRIGLDHERSGTFVLTAKEGSWFAYPWWTRKNEAPEYASHVDIHNKPGFDPCELYFGWPPFSISQDSTKIKGSHGRTGPGREVAWAFTNRFEKNPTSLIELAACVREWLDE